MARAMWLFFHAIEGATAEDWPALKEYDKHYWRVLAKAAHDALETHRRKRH
jgi:hypothetical protein